MKKLVYLLAFLPLFAFQCSDDDTTVDNSVVIQEVTQQTQNSDWIVTSFVDGNEDQTYHYTGFVFSFNEDGSLVATNGTDTYEGTWSVTSSSSSPDFNMNFSVGDDHPFDEFNDDWDIVSYSTTLIELYDVSGGNGDVHTLVFESL